MMDYVEALKVISIAIADVEWCYPLEYAVAFERAREAINKQIPKIPRDSHMKGDAITGYCPTCGLKQSYGSISWHRVFNKFCTDCGQALDWGDDE